MDFEIDDVMKILNESFTNNSGMDGGRASPISESINLFENEEIMRVSEHNPQHVVDSKQIISDYVNEHIDESKPTIRSSMRVYKPRLTRNTISLFEYVAVITKLAKYINSLSSLPAVIEDFLSDNLSINNIINPSELAWILLRNGVYNPIFDRGYEKVSFSELTVNPTWDNLIRMYFDTQHESIAKELLDDMFMNGSVE
jgi:hypothetical protein